MGKGLATGRRRFRSVQKTQFLGGVFDDLRAVGIDVLHLDAVRADGVLASCFR